MSSNPRRGSRRPKRRVSCFRSDGSVAAEFALVAPIVIVIAAGVADFGVLAARSAGLAATARIGAEYARLHPLDTSGIQNTMQSTMSFTPALSFPASFPFSCECDDGTAIACDQSCRTAGRRGPNRVFITISASQAFTPLVPWPGIPETLNAAMEVRLQ